MSEGLPSNSSHWTGRPNGVSEALFLFCTCAVFRRTLRVVRQNVNRNVRMHMKNQQKKNTILIFLNIPRSINISFSSSHPTFSQGKKNAGKYAWKFFQTNNCELIVKLRISEFCISFSINKVSASSREIQVRHLFLDSIQRCDSFSNIAVSFRHKQILFWRIYSNTSAVCRHDR